ncbi:MAG: radical SAM family heme chaperone HemW [Propionibacteriaceae bacterium]|jgi:oxygen-independent coproporphyrinogen-3 oxidase|nr:radical SAM family heme chaperone HemW [Propionibacteriaceae bacterium]
MAFGVYIHIPWCRARCGYCDFNTYVLKDLEFTPYLEAMVAELDLQIERNNLADRRVDTVFFGGGTPTVMGPSEFSYMLHALADRFEMRGAEITTEANPETVSYPFLSELRKVGINRISYGMQSADERVLTFLERLHTPERLPKVVGWARAAGFENLSLDLIYGSEVETEASWASTLKAAIALEPEHISAYSLTIEHGTRLGAKLARGEIRGIDPDVQAERYELAEDALASAGYENYEISNWALPGYECKHNLGYWRSDDWLGLGAGAHSHVAGKRWWNQKLPASYIEAAHAGVPEAGSETLNDEQRRTERVLLELRLAEGLDLGVLTPTESARLDRFENEGLLWRTDSRTGVTRAGRLLADGIVRDLLD